MRRCSSSLPRNRVANIKKLHALAQEIAHIHSRMPVVIPRKLTADWLSVDADVKSLIAEAESKVRFELAA
jgi:putative SOS response-associated peptidase YedK